MGSNNFDTFKVRCSAIGKIMSDSKSNPQITTKQLELLDSLEKKDKLTPLQEAEMARLIELRNNASRVVLSDTCIEYLMEAYSLVTAGKIPISKEAMDIIQTRKGNLAEGESIELLSILDGVPYHKNDERVNNDFLIGEPDMFLGDSIMESQKIIDAKSIWDYPTYLKYIHKPIEKGYDYQIKGYCDITGASQGEVAKCLVNTPQEIIEELKYKAAKKFGAVTMESPDFLREWEKWERSMVFDDIHINERAYRVQIQPFTQEERQKVYDRVKICRDWLNSFHETRLSLRN